MGKIASFITGAAVGVAATLLLAPTSGVEVRAFVVDKANAFAGGAKDFGASVPEAAQDVYNTVREKGAMLVKEIPGKAQGLADSATGKGSTVDSDELREKIEAARQRIAAQVMENAEQDNAVDVAANAAEKAQPEEAKAE